ncbi:MAG TPA: Uma2 family endonuclease [Thermoanaerobaculia bacterium]|nr:Uma2 family endonuclease [Thermoanaerobaculia bacterium]
MSQPAVALAPLPFELVFDDGEPLESEWHAMQLPLLREQIRQTMAEQDRADFYIGTNMFVYYSFEQAREVAEEEEKGLEQRAFRGPDVFWVGGIADPDRYRQAWIAWEEGGRLPHVIIELLSPSTAKKDRTEKRDLYAKVFGTAEYFLSDPDRPGVEGLRLSGQTYQPIPPDENGRVWSAQLRASFGIWHGIVQGRRNDWVRLFRPDGTLVPTAEERARSAAPDRQRAETERQRAEAAEAEVARLRALLQERNRG